MILARGTLSHSSGCSMALTRDSGAPSLGLFPLFPYASCPDDTVNGCIFPKLTRATPYKPESVRATPGYFGLELQSGVRGEMTTAFHTALFRFTFPQSDGGSPVVFLDLSDLSDSRQDNASISVDENGRMTGEGRFLPSFAQGTYVAYFCADFKGSIRDTGIYVNNRGSTDVKDLKISRSINGFPLPGGAFVRFQDSSPVLARVGLSFISSEQACQLAEDEISDFDFEGTQHIARAAWDEKMSPITVEPRGVDSSVLTNFYSGKLIGDELPSMILTQNRHLSDIYESTELHGCSAGRGRQHHVLR